jgi:hypothetical protein
MVDTMDSLDRQTVLWDFFSYSLFGLLGGLVLGLWWAGEGKRFKVSHIITFLGAFMLTAICWDLLWALLRLILYKGTVQDLFLLDHSNWALMTPWIGGGRKFLLYLEEYNFLPLIVIPLLFGAPGRIREFGKRALIIPLIFVLYLPMAFITIEWWESIQGQIVYEMHAADPDTRASAHESADTLLTRYPNHLQWPRIAEKLARFHYQNQRYEQSRSLYLNLIARYRDSNKWYWSIQRAQAAVKNPGFGSPGQTQRLQIPMVDYQRNLTHNWMALLAVMRYWEGTDVSESEVVIKLKDLSKSTDKIELNPLVSFAGLDDAARSLGYEMLLFRSDLNQVQALIEAGIPVIHQHYRSFNILIEIDGSRSAVCGYSFSKLSRRLRHEDRKEAKEILALEAEGHGESQKRLAHIANESYIEYSTAYWQNPSLVYMGPLTAIVFPAHKSPLVESALQKPFNELKAQSDGYLATLIALSYLDHGDPVSAVEWAQMGARKNNDPLPLYVSHLANVWWESRDKIIQSTLNLQNQFPELAQVPAYFNSPKNQMHLKYARQRFDQGFSSGTLPWFIIQRYFQLMDRSNADELDQILKLMQKRVSYDPSRSSDWIFLANICDWSADISGSVNALQGAVSSKPLDSEIKLRLAFSYIGLKKYDQAKSLLEEIDPQQIRYDADYSFCLGALAEWQGSLSTALENYAAAIEMRRYKPIYHLRYGRLLLKQGFEQKAKMHLRWAARIDAGNRFRKEALSLLSNMNK